MPGRDDDTEGYGEWGVSTLSLGLPRGGHTVDRRRWPGARKNRKGVDSRSERAGCGGCVVEPSTRRGTARDDAPPQCSHRSPGFWLQAGAPMASALSGQGAEPRGTHAPPDPPPSPVSLLGPPRTLPASPSATLRSPASQQTPSPGHDAPPISQGGTGPPRRDPLVFPITPQTSLKMPISRLQCPWYR